MDPPHNCFCLLPVHSMFRNVVSVPINPPKLHDFHPTLILPGARHQRKVELARLGRRRRNTPPVEPNRQNTSIGADWIVFGAMPAIYSSGSSSRKPGPVIFTPNGKNLVLDIAET